MKIKSFNILLFSLMLLLVSAQSQYAERTNGKKVNSLNKTTGSPSYSKFNINKISTWIKNDGESDINQNGNSGFVYPKGTNKACVFQSGFLWGGKVNGEVRVGGSTYNQGQIPGRILADGTAEDPTLEHVRIYRVRRDYKTGNLTPEAVDQNLSTDEIKAQYEKDWDEWPAEFGAPYEDVDGDGAYDPEIDKPGQPGADQTIWFVNNDFAAQNLYASPPMGIEMQATIFGYNRVGPLGSVMFRKYLIINKSSDNFSDFYVCMWSDPDVGDATDDFSGCDTSLSLGYTYNANATDATYESTPPATGFDFFQGPVVTGEPTDVAKSMGRRLPGKKNLGMSAFFFFINDNSSIYRDPSLQEYAEGTLEMYNLLQGKIGSTGQFFTDPITGQPTTFTLSGDPLTGTGWIDGLSAPAGDRRIGMVAGPFTMAAGDTQEVVVGELAAGATPGVTNLDAIRVLKQYDAVAQKTYDTDFQVPAPPKAPVVEVIELDEKIILNWGNDIESAIVSESHNSQGYTFQGYNVYQLPFENASLGESKKLVTFDVIDELKTIVVKDVDPTTGVDIDVVAQTGTDSGVRRYLEIDKDMILNQPLVNGKKYYFAVTAYAYNPDQLSVPQVLENDLIPLTIVPHSTDPGVRYYTETEAGLDVEQISGLANATVSAKVIDPTKVTGHEYEVFFNEQHYYLDKDGVWKKTNSPDAISKVGDVSPSTMYGMGFYSANSTIDLILEIDLQSPEGAYIDGVKLTFPAGITIYSAGDVEDCANEHVESPVIDGQTITWGNNDSTRFGCFDGHQELRVKVSQFTAPLSIAYILYDDAYALDVIAGGGTATIANAEGTFEVTDLEYNFVTQSHWNVRDLTTGEIKLEDQTIVGTNDIYAGVEGPGGSSGTQLGTNVGSTASPIFDGIQVAIVQGGYDPPTNILRQVIIRDGVTYNLGIGNGGRTPYDLANYILFGNSTGWAVEAQGYGSTSIDDLQQDYEYRFTGELDSVTINGSKVYITKEGTGSMATFYGARQYDWSLHPLNPTGTQERFMARIPFEVWNIDKGIQVNYQFYDRSQSNPAADGFSVWVQNNRMYGEILDTPYDPNTPADPEVVGDSFTWNNVWYNSLYRTGDIIRQFYANPIQIGKDVFRFTAPKATTTDDELAKEDVKEINVFPNPYYGVNSQELNKYQRFVTFNHLPLKATIRIFNLAGQLVRTIDKNSNSQFTRWDLLNKSGLPVASGLYIVYIDMPDLGTTKILKAAIIQEQQILDRF